MQENLILLPAQLIVCLSLEYFFCFPVCGSMLAVAVDAFILCLSALGLCFRFMEV